MRFHSLGFRRTEVGSAAKGRPTSQVAIDVMVAFLNQDGRGRVTVGFSFFVLLRGALEGPARAFTGRRLVPRCENLHWWRLNKDTTTPARLVPGTHVPAVNRASSVWGWIIRPQPPRGSACTPPSPIRGDNQVAKRYRAIDVAAWGCTCDRWTRWMGKEEKREGVQNRRPNCGSGGAQWVELLVNVRPPPSVLVCCADPRASSLTETHRQHPPTNMYVSWFAERSVSLLGRSMSLAWTGVW